MSLFAPITASFNPGEHLPPKREAITSDFGKLLFLLRISLLFCLYITESHSRSNGLVVKDIATGAGDLGSIPGPVKSDAVLPTARHRCDVS